MGKPFCTSAFVFKTVAVLVITVEIVIIVQLNLFSQHVCKDISNANERDTRKPLIVVGILTVENNTELRDAQRRTWISTAMSEDIPFRFMYKFLLDEPSPKTIEENSVRNDIVFLNVTQHGFAKRFGEKIYIWFKYIVQNYPDALLGARVDDDVFVCVPQLFERLQMIKSRTLYYGWAHAPGREIGGRRRIDEMFVVLGNSLMERISKRELCKSRHICDGNRKLVSWDWATAAITMWLSIYDDIDMHIDNDKIIQFGRHKFKQFAKYIKPNFCDNYLIYHKSTPEIMRQLHRFNLGTNAGPIPLDNLSTPGATTGDYFSGEVIRELPHKEYYERSVKNAPSRINDMPNCNNWAVVTTIFAPSYAVKQIAMKPNVCLVIVADVKTPKMEVYMKDIKNNNVTFLTVEEQQKMYPILSRSIPFNHFGRKNIGYIYAIKHGAKSIWDFDDDNIGMININDVESSKTFVTLCEGFDSNITNPYSYFGNRDRIWPRGFPLQYIKDNSKVPKVCKTNDNVSLGVAQSLANVDPDVDAIYRLTNDLPFNFTASKETHMDLVLPKYVYAPFNAQATLWYSSAFKYMALPVSVNGRVSDIWRAYISQYFMHKHGDQIAFTIPYVTQMRNQHDLIRDFNAEQDLYKKSKQLVDLLSSEKGEGIQSLIDMYEILFRRGYLEQDDLKFINTWVQYF